MNTFPHAAEARIRHARHRVSVNDRHAVTDRCSSGLLWWTVARAVVQGRPVRIDGRPVTWNRADALAYLQRTAHKKWWKDLR